jgi:serine protease Do
MIFAGSVVHLKVARNGQTRDVDVTLDELSETASASTGSENVTKALQGVEVQNLTPSIARDLGISASTRGVVVSSVDPSSAAAAADLERGDIIQEVNRKPVLNVAEYNEVLSATRDQSVLLLVKRGTATRFVVIEPQ